MRRLYLFLFLLSNFISLDARESPQFKSPGGFIENKDQIHDQNFNPNPEVKYLLSTPGMNVQLRTNSFSYDTYTIEQKENSTGRRNINKKINSPTLENIYHFHRIDIEFIDANPTPQIVSENPSETYFNYYTSGTSEKGATNVRSFEKITYKNLYPNTDLEFVTENGKVKYNFILHYGADLNKIRWQYKGSENTNINGENISIKVSHGSFEETIPESYLTLEKNNSGKKNMKVNFMIYERNVYGFAPLSSYCLRYGELLVIDPTLTQLWSTYYGGNNDDYIFGSCVDKLGNTYYSGTASSLSSIATVGSYQTVCGGSYDAFILKLNSGGIPQWATYYGGNGEDAPQTCGIDLKNNVYLAGYTTSSASISTVGSHQPGYGNNQDAFLVKFNNAGFRLWATYYGGCGKDIISNIKTDSLYNIYFTGGTTSIDSISTLGSHQPTYGGIGFGTYGDAILVKFDSSGVRQWGTYFGGPDNDGGQCIITKGINIYLCGATQSSTQISTPNTYQNSITNIYAEMFLTKFSSTGVQLWGTYYGGSGNDLAYTMLIDPNDYIYLCGTSDGGFPTTAGAYQTTHAGIGNDGAIVKFREGTVLNIQEFGSLNDNQINIFPNPNNGSFIIEAKEDLTLSVVNELGQSVKILKLDASNNHQASVSNLATGVYCIMDKQSGKAIQNKVVVTK